MIRARYQNQKESVGVYFASMINLFNPLEQPPTEEEKVYVLKRNILPYLIHHLAACDDIKTVESLKVLCKKFEINRELASRPRLSLTPHISSIEPDLAGGVESPSSVQVVVGDSMKLMFWVITTLASIGSAVNPGMVFECPKPRSRKFCYRCGKLDVTRYSCQHCAKNGRSSRR